MRASQPKDADKDKDKGRDKGKESKSKDSQPADAFQRDNKRMWLGKGMTGSFKAEGRDSAGSAKGPSSPYSPVRRKSSVRGMSGLD